MTTLTTTTPELPLYRVTDRDGDVVARIFRGENKFFALMSMGEVVQGPFDDQSAAEEAALAWVHACEAMKMWESMVDT